MFNIGPMELVVLGIVAIIVIGPDRLPDMARDAARMIRTLRELATGARTQLRDELGPEFADMDLRNLNPRTALQRMILGDDEDGLRADLRKLDPREDLRALDVREDLRALDVRDDLHAAVHHEAVVPADVNHENEAVVSMRKAEQRPLGRGEAAPFDSDAT